MEIQSAQAQIDLVYHGPDVESGSMEIRDLAPAMLAMATLFESAALVANRGSCGKRRSRKDQHQFKIHLH